MNRSTSPAASDIFVEGGKHEYRIKDQQLTAPAMRAINGVQKVANSGSIEKSLQELVKIRASQINGCAYCLAMHWKDALKIGERIDRLATLDSWREADWFTDRERAAMAWTEALTKLNEQGVTEDLYQAVSSQFSEQEMIDLTVNIVAINSWNRMAIGFSSRPTPFGLDEVQ